MTLAIGFMFCPFSEVEWFKAFYIAMMAHGVISSLDWVPSSMCGGWKTS
jgi:hypothetical protein